MKNVAALYSYIRCEYLYRTAASTRLFRYISTKKMVCVYCFLRQSYVISSRQIKQITIKIDIKESRINVEKDRGLDYAWRSTRIIRDMSTLCCREWFQAEVMMFSRRHRSADAFFALSRAEIPNEFLYFCATLDNGLVLSL